MQPIVVRPLSGGRYQLITGERRWLASRKAQKTTIPAIVRQVADEQVLEMTIIENLQRTDLNPMEQARAYQRLSQDFQLTQEQMATRTGKERASVANFLRLLKLPEAVQQKVESGDLTFGHARSPLGPRSPESITSAAQKVLALSLSVRQTESYVQNLINPEAKQNKEDKQANPTRRPQRPRSPGPPPAHARPKSPHRRQKRQRQSNHRILRPRRLRRHPHRTRPGKIKNPRERGHTDA